MFLVAQIADAVIEAPISNSTIGTAVVQGDECMRTWSLLVLLSLVVGLLIFSDPSVVLAASAQNLGGSNLAGANLAGSNLAGANLAGHNGVQVNISGSVKSTGFVLDGFKVVSGRLIVGQ